MEEIFKRRSVRKFLDKDVSEEDITKMLQAAMRAPSAGNEQPWEFIIIKNPETMVKIIDFHPYATMLKQTKCAIVICGNIDLQKFDYDFWIQDCSAATQNLLIEATHLNLGAVWLAAYPVEERVIGVTKLLNLPSNVIPLNIIAVGHPENYPKPIDTYSPERVHNDKW
ncbi:MAG: nitroreductase family protein [Coprobacillaceae bacterium]